jgi:hypothetical protein
MTHLYSKNAALVIRKRASPASLRSTHTHAPSRLDTLVARGLEASTYLRAGFVNATQLIRSEKGAGVEKGQRVQAIANLALFSQKIVAPNTFFPNLGFPFGIALKGENRETSTTRPAIFAVEDLFAVTRKAVKGFEG